MAAQRGKQAKQQTRAASQPDGGGAAASESPSGWPLWARASATALVVWHMAVVFLSPLSVEPRSPLVANIAQSKYVRWYSDPLYLNHGYHFFAPNPPLGGQLIRYTVQAEDGRVLNSGEFPSLDEQWPRLWYHRHMMLADQMAGMGVYGAPEADARLMMQAYARHLLAKHDGYYARLDSVFHRSLRPEEVLDGADPYDARLYEVTMSVEQRSEDLQTPLVVEPRPAGGPQPAGGSPGAAAPEEVPIGVGG
ncbi:MAG: hypothetical protein AAF790_02745 [Planctomycetota bacterium]